MVTILLTLIRLNQEIGNETEFEEINNRLKNLKMGWLQDIVPNHMAFHYKNRLADGCSGKWKAVGVLGLF